MYHKYKEIRYSRILEPRFSLNRDDSIKNGGECKRTQVYIYDYIYVVLQKLVYK